MLDHLSSRTRLFLHFHPIPNRITSPMYLRCIYSSEAAKDDLARHYPYRTHKALFLVPYHLFSSFISIFFPTDKVVYHLTRLLSFPFHFLLLMKFMWVFWSTHNVTEKVFRSPRTPHTFLEWCHGDHAHHCLAHLMAIHCHSELAASGTITTLPVIVFPVVRLNMFYIYRDLTPSFSA